MKLRIEKAIYGGDGLARIPADSPLDAGGKTVFVPYALPGELVEAHIAEERRSFATADSMPFSSLRPNGCAPAASISLPAGAASISMPPPSINRG